MHVYMYHAGHCGGRDTVTKASCNLLQSTMLPCSTMSCSARTTKYVHNFMHSISVQHHHTMHRHTQVQCIDCKVDTWRLEHSSFVRVLKCMKTNHITSIHVLHVQFCHDIKQEDVGKARKAEIARVKARKVGITRVKASKRLKMSAKVVEGPNKCLLY